jgi:hypothetical protein
LCVRERDEMRGGKRTRVRTCLAGEATRRYPGGWVRWLHVVSGQSRHVRCVALLCFALIGQSIDAPFSMHCIGEAAARAIDFGRAMDGQIDRARAVTCIDRDVLFTRATNCSSSFA